MARWVRCGVRWWRSLVASWRSNPLLVLLVSWCAVFMAAILVVLWNVGVVAAFAVSLVYEAGVIGLLVAARMRGRRRVR